MRGLKIGLFGIGPDTYWDQFAGQKKTWESYLATVEKKILAIHPVSTYTLSPTVLPVVQQAKVPVMVLNLYPEPAMNYLKLNSMTDRNEMTCECFLN
ncbi:MAG: hypothetical protein M3O71_15785 [Bacteroidota bacterium]|nr:hypothetical protein [Bacteroidota bacterium]